MRAGELDQRVTLYSKSATKGSLGEESVTWAVVDTVWAKVVPQGGREVLAGAQIQRVVDYRLQIRVRPGVNEDLRMVWHSIAGDVPLDIVAVLMGTNQFKGMLDIYTVNGVRNGR
jgi:head-tail adaptor